MIKDPSIRTLRLRTMARHAINCGACMSNVKLLQHSRDPLTRTAAMCAIEACESRRRPLRVLR